MKRAGSCRKCRSPAFAGWALLQLLRVTLIALLALRAPVPAAAQTAPSAPTSVVVTVTGAQSANVNVTLGANGGSAVNSVEASCRQSGGSVLWSGSSAVSGATFAVLAASGLAANSSHTCSATATNGVGTSPATTSTSFNTFASRKLATGTLFRNGTSGLKLFVSQGAAINSFVAYVYDLDSSTWSTAAAVSPQRGYGAACTWDEADTIYCAVRPVFGCLKTPRAGSIVAAVSNAAFSGPSLPLYESVHGSNAATCTVAAATGATGTGAGVASALAYRFDGAYPGDGLPGITEVVAATSGVRSARVEVRFRYNGGVSVTGAAASCVVGLQPSTVYMCSANATNGNGISSNVLSGNFTTFQDGVSVEAKQLATGVATMARRFVAGVLFRNSTGSPKFAAMGGTDGTAYGTSVWVLDIDSNTWATAAVVMPVATRGPACGWDEADTIYCASTTAFWSFATNMTTRTTLEPVPLSVVGSCGTFWNGAFYVFTDLTGTMYWWTANTNWVKGTTTGTYTSDGLPGVADVVTTVTGVLTARVVARFRYNGGVSMTSAAASCGPLAGGPAEWSAVTAVQSGAWSATFLASGLQANTTYVCWANATNGAGTSANVWSGNFTTYGARPVSFRTVFVEFETLIKIAQPKALK
eukprot:tig00000158_g10205.t1